MEISVIGVTKIFEEKQILFPKLLPIYVHITQTLFCSNMKIFVINRKRV